VKLTVNLTKKIFPHQISENLYQSCGIQGNQYEQYWRILPLSFGIWPRIVWQMYTCRQIYRNSTFIPLIYISACI